jgi:hypothetical protein
MQDGLEWIPQPASRSHTVHECMTEGDFRIQVCYIDMSNKIVLRSKKKSVDVISHE